MAGNNWPLRGGKFSNFEGGIRVNAFVTGGLARVMATTLCRLLHKPGCWDLPGAPEKLENWDFGTNEGPHTAMTT